ncbi:MAG: SusC/RagA family TonB-linked outer membrane protein [Rubricoccaceae bacterium]|nr:SusC/RagA family TonB-linked outer membrane protein [Rubricoccaceae bacterium]
MKLAYCGSASLVPALLFLFAGTVFAQTTVGGTVTDAVSGETLPGVNVVVEGTTVGTATNLDGVYSISVPAGFQTLVFSFVGYRTLEADLSPGATTLDVQLREDVLGLDEVVVSGLGSSIARSNLANSVETISARELADVTTNQTLDGAINGKVTGAVISAYTGAPGGGLSVKLRGITTINGSAQPLFILDGVIISNDAIQNGVNAVTAAAAAGNPAQQDQPVNRLADLSPDDIESIEILKGPSAAAIYGARASNGVVIITTKSGRAGTGVQFNVSQSVGFASISNRIGVRQFTAATAEEQFGETGLQLFNESGGQFIDYEDELYGHNGRLLTTRISAAGGNENTTFYVSGLIKDDEGIVERTGYEKQSGRVNLSHRFSQRASVDVSTNYIRSVARRGLTGNVNTGTTFGVSLAATPGFIDLRPDANGVYPDHPFNSSNPLQVRDLADIGETTNRFIGSGRLTYNLFHNETQNLQAIAEGGIDYWGLDQSAVFPRGLQFYQGVDLPGQSIQGRTTNLNSNLRGLLVHSLSVPNSNLFFTTQGGLTYFSQDLDRSNAVASGLIAGQENLDQAASLQTTQFQLSQDDRALFAQEEVNWANRIIGTVGVRGERSSLNGDVAKYYTYPKASVAVNLSNFDFWSVSSVDLLKLRLAVGQTGNTAPFGARYTTFGSTSIDGNVGITINDSRGLADVKPERATEFEGGIDLALFDGRANLEATVYRKVVDDLVLTRQLPPSSGFATETINAGELTNRGIEIGLNLIPVQSNGFQWVSRTSFWTYDSEVTRLDVPAFTALGGGFGSTLGIIRIEEGMSPTQIIGIDDVDGDGTSDGEFLLGDVAPDFQMSFFNDFTFGENLTLTVFGHWKSGGDVINLSELLLDLLGTTADFDANAAERLAALGVSAVPFVQDASYFKLREVGLYYRVPERILGSTIGSHIRNLRIGVSGTNLLTITPYKSYDPEVHNFGDTPVASGVEVLPYPSSRNILFHLSFGL